MRATFRFGPGLPGNSHFRYQERIPRGRCLYTASGRSTPDLKLIQAWRGYGQRSGGLKLLSLVDALRTGRARERKLAGEHLSKLLLV